MRPAADADASTAAGSCEASGGRSRPLGVAIDAPHGRGRVGLVMPGSGFHA